MATAVMLLIDCTDPALISAVQHALALFANLFALQAAPTDDLRVGVCGLASSGGDRVQLQVKLRPAPYSLRELSFAIAKLQPGTVAVDSAQAAGALQSLLGVLASDAAFSGAPRRTLVLVSDRLHEAADFAPLLALTRERGVRLELLAACSPQQASAAAAGPWAELETQFPHLALTLAPNVDKATLDCLACTLLQRCIASKQLAVSLQFKKPLLGEVHTLRLRSRTEIWRLSHTVEHCTLCPCHSVPTQPTASATTCGVSGAPLGAAQCARDARSVRVGAHAGGTLHFGSDFTITSAEAGHATLTVVQRVKQAAVNPALLFGMPVLLFGEPAPAGAAAGAGGLTLVAEGQLHVVGPGQLLQGLCCALRDADEVLLVSSTTDLETGQSGLLRLHYMLIPCEHELGEGSNGSPGSADTAGPAAPGFPALCAKRLASAEELKAPLLPLGLDHPPARLAPALQCMLEGQLGDVPLSNIQPWSLHSRCHDVLLMLVRESRPAPKPVQAPAPPPAAAAAAPVAAGAAADGAAQPAVPAAAAGRRRESVGRASGQGGGSKRGERQQGVSKSALDLKKRQR